MSLSAATSCSLQPHIMTTPEDSGEFAPWEFDPSLPDNGPMVNTAVWCLFGVATIFIGLRVYCKFSRHRGLWWDDHVLIASWVRTSLHRRRHRMNFQRQFDDKQRGFLCLTISIRYFSSPPPSNSASISRMASVVPSSTSTLENSTMSVLGVWLLEHSF